jgi:hypothetical protein
MQLLARSAQHARQSCTSRPFSSTAAATQKPQRLKSVSPIRCHNSRSPPLAAQRTHALLPEPCPHQPHSHGTKLHCSHCSHLQQPPPPFACGALLTAVSLPAWMLLSIQSSRNTTALTAGTKYCKIVMFWKTRPISRVMITSHWCAPCMHVCCRLPASLYLPA